VWLAAPRLLPTQRWGASRYVLQIQKENVTLCPNMSNVQQLAFGGNAIVVYGALEYMKKGSSNFEKFGNIAFHQMKRFHTKNGCLPFENIPFFVSHTVPPELVTHSRCRI
jgi:hypothetical protein